MSQSWSLVTLPQASPRYSSHDWSRAAISEHIVMNDNPSRHLPLAT